MAKAVTDEMRKKAWDYGSKSKEHYNVLTSEQKKAFWEYGKTNNLYDANKLDDFKKNEFNTYLNTPKPTIKKLNLDTTRPSVQSGGRPMINFDQKKLDKASGTAGAFTANLVDSATLGAAPKIVNVTANLASRIPIVGKNIPHGDITESYKKQLTDASKGHDVASTLGGLTGYALPFAGASKIVGSGGKALVKAGAKPITNKILKTAVVGAIEGSLVGGAEGGIKGNNVVKSAGEMAALGVGGNLAIAGAGKLIGKVLKPRVFEPKVETPIVKTPKIEPNKPIKKIELSGTKFKVNNPQYEKAVTKYNDAIETIQNHFQTNKLVPDEIARIKTELGIDLDALTNNIAKYENKINLKEISKVQNQKYVYGVENRLTPKLKGSSKVITPNAQELRSTTSTNANMPIAEQVPTSAKEKFNFKNAYDKFYTRVVDAKNPLKPLGEDTYIKATNSKMVGGTVDHIFTKNLVDKEGKAIGDSLKTIAESIPKESEKDFWIYSRQKHNIARAAQNKPIYSDFSPERSAAEVARYEALHPEWKNINKNITTWIDKFMNEWGVKSGVIDSKAYNELRKIYPDYIPTQREFSELEKGIPNVNGRGFVDQSSPIKSATGSDRGLTPTLENIMNLVNRTVRTARYNEVGQGLLKSIRENPSALAEIIPEGTVINPNVKNIVTVLENGKSVNVKVNDKSLLEALQGMTKSGDDITNAVRKVSGVYKSLITQKNPLFAVRNIARDVPTYLTNSTESNPIKALGNLGGAVKDIITRSDSLNQYKALGGGGSNFFNSGDTAKSLKKLTSEPNVGRKILNGIDKFNNLTETAPRLAEFKKVLKDTGDTQKALYASSDVTTNFSRGGDLTKSVDAYVPYLNAGVQGLDKMARQFKNRPIATILKGATVVTAPTLILNHMNKDNPNYQALDNRTKDNYFLIPNGDTFIKLPKSRELGVLFGSLAERTLRKLSGEQNAFKGFDTTVKTNFSPTNPLENNLVSPILNLKSNKDFANRDIVPRTMKDQNLSGRYQYDEKTSEIAKKMGEITNLSPKQIDYIIKSYTGVIGQLSLPAMTKSTYSGQGGSNILKPITSQFVSDPLYSNQTLTDFYDNLDMLKQKAADRNFNEKLPAIVKTKEEILKSRFTKAQDRMADLTKLIKQETDQKKIRELRQKMLDIANNANKSLK